MDREEALSLLRELTRVFESLSNVPIVSITNDKETGKWELLVNWVPDDQEKTSLNTIAAKHGSEVGEEEGYTIFR